MNAAPTEALRVAATSMTRRSIIGERDRTMTTTRPDWTDRLHGFREDVNDYSMCVCGVPSASHYAWEEQQARLMVERGECICLEFVDGVAVVSGVFVHPHCPQHGSLA